MKVKSFLESLYKVNNAPIFLAGVPDSLLASMLLSINEFPHFIEKYHTVPNEGNAIALSAGYYLSQQKIPFVYLQNSGLGNIVNPLTSLVSKDVYDIPLILIIGWRGEPELVDEPQHRLMGRITIELLRLMEVSTLQFDSSTSTEQLDEFLSGSNHRKALVVKKKSFEAIGNMSYYNQYTLNRYEVIETIVKKFEDAIFIATTGKTSRELFDIRQKNSMSHSKDLLNVGAMGHTSSIALGLSLSNPNQQVICLDGDGAILMHMGILGKIAQDNPSNLIHVILDNEVHESVGGFKNSSPKIEFEPLLNNIGYKKIYFSYDIENFNYILNFVKPMDGLTAIILKIKNFSNNNLGRPEISPTEQKLDFIQAITKKS
jgi:phosphonopyruvate decarboxylase